MYYVIKENTKDLYLASHKEKLVTTEHDEVAQYIDRDDAERACFHACRNLGYEFFVHKVPSVG